MKTLLFIIAIATFTSCSTVYKSGQTPDDLYYSKPKVQITEDDRYMLTDNSYQDRQIRMAAYDYRWRSLDDRYDYNYRYNPYSYGYNYGYYYNPYYYSYPVYGNNVVFINPKNTSIRTTNLSAYNNTITNYSATKAGNNIRTTTVRGYNNSNYQTQRSRDYSSESNNSRIYTPSSSNSNNNSSNSNNSSRSAPTSTGTPVQRPGRGQ